ncbi:cellulose biosynthesis protein CelD [Novosphingobium sp. AAP83]|nr:cellulose biosynthesis protein CelD [Novosphingobium sp. AAP83]
MAPELIGSPCAQATSWRKWAAPAARKRWQALADDAATPNPFFEPWYLLPALEAFDARAGVKLLTVEIAGQLIGLIPLCTSSRYGRWPLPHRTTWMHANAFFGVPLVRAGFETLFWQALLDWADDTPGKALFLHLQSMPLDQIVTQALLNLAARENRTVALVTRERRALLQSSLAPEAYLENALNGKKRKELRRQSARLAEQGALSFKRTQTADGIGQWIDAFLHLENNGWKGKAGSAMICAPQTEAIFRTALEQAAALGKLERLSLELDGRPIAMLANFITPPGSFSYKTTFDEAYARFSPGVLLQRENLALLERQDIAWCDSCAAPDHPMIDSLWTERRSIGRISVAIGGKLRRAVFKNLNALELKRNPLD